MTDAIAFDDVAIHADGGCRIASAQQWQLQQQRRLGATDRRTQTTTREEMASSALLHAQQQQQRMPPAHAAKQLVFRRINCSGSRYG